MAQALYFQGQRIGEHLIRYEPANALLTPPARGAGFLQPLAAIDAVSRNLLAAWEFTVALARADEHDMARALEAIQRLQGLRGVVEVRRDMTVKARFTDWTLDLAPRAGLRALFGGRVVEEYSLIFVGASPPAFF